LSRVFDFVSSLSVALSFPHLVPDESPGALRRAEEGLRRGPGPQGRTGPTARSRVRAGQIFAFFAGEALRIAGEKVASVRPNVDVDCVCLTEILCCYQEPYPLRISLVLKRSAGPNSDELSEALGQTTGYIQPRCPPSMHRRSGASVGVGRNPRADSHLRLARPHRE
jgi:hypothetical protein